MKYKFQFIFHSSNVLLNIYPKLMSFCIIHQAPVYAGDSCKL